MLRLLASRFFLYECRYASMFCSAASLLLLFFLLLAPYRRQVSGNVEGEAERRKNSLVTLCSRLQQSSQLQKIWR